jgi:tetratricopeptide (TPR) repeat protein
MVLDPYAACPCGSGKKFKWCCQPIHVQIDKAFRQDDEGQHEAALRLMDEVVTEHSANPEAWGRKAQLLYQNDRVEEAEATLQKALEINPKYPFGHLLRGLFRQHEGEIPGALLQFRKAADFYDPEARDLLAQVYAMIGDSELRLNRPVAARAAFQIALHCRPADETLRQTFDQVFGEGSHLPASARREYRFLEPIGSAGASPSRSDLWKQALAEATTGKLTDARAAFEKLSQEEPDNPAAWYNLGLAKAWLGDNSGAVEALDRYVTLEPEEARAASAWVLAAVLRCGHGMEGLADYLEHSAMFQLGNPEPVVQFLQRWETEGRLVGVKISQETGVVTGVVVETLPALTPELAATQAPGLSAYLLLVGGLLRLWQTNLQALTPLVEEVKQKLGTAISEAQMGQAVAAFGEILGEALAFPIRAANQTEAQERITKHAQRFFEEIWIHRPLRSLNLIPPIDAAGHPALRRKLLGAIQFLADCAAPNPVLKYDFNRLRRKLGLITYGASSAQAGEPAGLDISALAASELAALKPEELSDDQLAQAYQASVKLDARELAARFAQSLVGRPYRAGQAERYSFYSHLIQMAVSAGNTQAALDWINEGEKADCEQNEGKRRNDYELRRGQIHSKRGEADQAQDVFERLIGRSPSELRYRGSAAEAMLSARQPARALRFAEEGLAKARQQNDRDSENYFKELVAAAKKQG